MATNLHGILGALILFLAASCEPWSGESGHRDPQGPPTLPISLEERTVTVSSTSSQEESRALGIASESRPEGCFGTDQPAVVRVQPNDAGPRLPVWTCREGCAPGFEPVTTVTVSTGRRRRSNTKYGYFTAECEPVCGDSTHRVSYLLDSSAEAAATCAPGGPGDLALAASRREDDRRVTAVLYRWKADFDGLGTQIAALERSPLPWSEEVLEEFRGADARLGTMEKNVKSWFKAAPAVSPMSENYKGADETVAAPARMAFLTRVRAGLPANVKHLAEALRDRVESMRGTAKRTAARAAAERERAEFEASRVAEIASENRARQECAEGCGRTFLACVGRCRGLTAAVCDTCALGRNACLPKCEKAE